MCISLSIIGIGILCLQVIEIVENAVTIFNYF